MQTDCCHGSGGCSITSRAKGGVLIVQNSEGNGTKYVMQDCLLLVKANTYNFNFTAAAIAVTGSG